MANPNTIEYLNRAVDYAESKSNEFNQKVRDLVGFNSLPLNELDPDLYGSLGVYNILNDYNWTINGKTQRTNIPYMVLTEYQMDGNMLLTNLKYWVKQITKTDGAANNPYANLYRAKPTTVEYIFPWFQDFHHSINQNWGEFQGLDTTKAGEIITKAVSFLAGVPGVSINTPKEWKGPSPATIPYEITLFNTGNPEDIDKNILDNRRFINRLIMSTLHDQANSILALPPAIFTLNIPNIRQSPACVISNLDITNIGVLKLQKKDDTGFQSDITIPEAYRIKFTITELITESRQLFDAANTGRVVTAMTQE